MKNIFYQGPFIFLLLSVINCNPSEKSSAVENSKELILNSLYSIHLNSPEIISRIDDHHGIKIDSKGERFLLADRGKNQILVTDTLGNAEVVIGQTGRGPREFLSIDGLTFISDESFLVHDESLALMKMFKIDGSLIGSFRPSIDGYYFSSPDFIVNDSIIYSSILESEYVAFVQQQNYEKMAESKIMIAIDTSGNEIGKYGSYDSLTPESKDYAQFSVLGISKGWGKVFVNQLDSPIIQYYDLENDSFNVFSEQVPDNYIRAKEFLSLSSSRKKIMEMSVGRMYAEKIVPLKNHLFKSIDILTQEFSRTRDPMDKEQILVVYNEEGSIVAEKRLEEKRLFGGLGNKLYFLTDSNPDNFTIEVATYSLEPK